MREGGVLVRAQLLLHLIQEHGVLNLVHREVWVAGRTGKGTEGNRGGYGTYREKLKSRIDTQKKGQKTRSNY